MKPKGFEAPREGSPVKRLLNNFTRHIFSTEFEYDSQNSGDAIRAAALGLGDLSILIADEQEYGQQSSLGLDDDTSADLQDLYVKLLRGGIRPTLLRQGEAELRLDKDFGFATVIVRGFDSTPGNRVFKFRRFHKGEELGSGYELTITHNGKNLVFDYDHL